MSRSDQKIVQYLKEARASELALVRVLQSQIAMTPNGTFRTGLEAHLEETREHAARLKTRVRELEDGRNPVQVVLGVAEAVAGQALALAKTPGDLVRGTGGEEKVLKNAKDAASTEALEIATYTSLEQLATLAGDETTAALAASIREDEQAMLDRILEEIPALTEAVYRADVEGDPSYDVTETGAADAVREAGHAAKDAAREARTKAQDAGDAAKDAGATAKSTGATAKAASGTAAKAAKDTGSSAKAAAKDASGTAAKAAKDTGSSAKAAAKDASGTAKGTAKAAGGTAAKAAKTASDSAAEAAGEASETAAKAAEDAGEGAAKAAQQAGKKAAKAADRAGTSTAKAAKSTGDAAARTAEDAAETSAKTAARAGSAAEDAAPEGTDDVAERPWPGYDELSVEEVLAVLLTADAETKSSVESYERAHQAREGILARVAASA